MLKLAEVNALDPESFTIRLRPVFEHSPWVAARTAQARPFGSRKELHAALCRTVRQAHEDEKLALIRAYPDLVGDAVLTNESRVELKSAGFADLSPDEISVFAISTSATGKNSASLHHLCAAKQEGRHPESLFLAAEKFARTRDQDRAQRNLPNRRAPSVRPDPCLRNREARASARALPEFMYLLSATLDPRIKLLDRFLQNIE